MRNLLKAIAIAVIVLAVACTPGADPGPDPEQPDRKARPGRHDVSCSELDQFIQRVRRGHYPDRATDVALVAHEPNYLGQPTAAIHTGPYDFLAEVPLVAYGPPYVEPIGSVEEAPTTADIAPTIARVIGFDDYAAPDGHALTTGLPEASEPPRVVVTVVWDGGGWNTLRAHPRRWPFLRSLIERGVSFENMTIGSTPSVTPPIHTTLGTGAFPRRHGIPSVTMISPDGRFIRAMELNNPKDIEVPTLGDIYDEAMRNRPLVGVVATVNWHLGMIGKGTLHPGGDDDLAALFGLDGLAFGDPDFYEIPYQLNDAAGLEAAAARLDAQDGARDGRWRGHELDDLDFRWASPATVRWMAERLRTVIDDYGFGKDRIPDLLYTNFKSIDDAVHIWGIEARETADVIAASDAELKRLVHHLDASVGKGRWVMLVTADHGTMPFAADSGGYAVTGSNLRVDLNRAFDLDPEGENVFQRLTGGGIFLNDAAAERAQLDYRALGRWLLDYTAEDNLDPGEEIPAYYRDNADVPLFDAVVHGRKVVARSCRK